MARFSPFERQRRRCSRIALYSNLVLVLALLAIFLQVLAEPLARQADQDWTDVDFAALPEVDLLRRYIAIDTSFPEGSEVEGARFLASLIEAEGIPVTLEELPEDRANLWAVLEGARPEALVLHHHIDVEPVPYLAEWRHDPYGGEIEGPWLYGRGTFDMKSVGVAQLEAFLALKRSGRRLDRSVIYLATSSEETGSQVGMRWILDHHPELTSRFWAVLTEGGAIELPEAGEIKYWGTEFAQKRYVNHVLCSDNRELLETMADELRAHGKTPLGFNRLTSEVATFLRSYAPSRSSKAIRALLEHPERLTWNHQEFLKAPLPVQSMLRDELHVFPIEETPGGYQMTVKVHLLHGSDLEEVAARLLPEWLTYGATGMWIEGEPPAIPSPLDHPVYRTIDSLLVRRYGRDAVGPLFLTWSANDSRFVRARGIPSYGFSPFATPTPEVLTLLRFGKAEERIALPAYVEGVALYRELVEKLVS
jgi:acetylornithine deacetylase/succinyl-diaminopimelate desuccinylase-like protein